MLETTLQNTVDLSTEITRAKAGSLFLLNSEGVVTDCIMMRETGPAIGILSDAQFALESVYLDHGETLIGFTDGITDACSNSGERFCRSGIGATIQGSSEPSEKLMQSIIDGVFGHLDGCELTDDIAMISISRMPKA